MRKTIFVTIGLCFAVLCGTFMLKAAPATAPAATTAPAAGDVKVEPITKGLRIFTCGHSFHVFVPPILADMAKSAELKDHEQLGMSTIGGSKVIQHWDIKPDEKNPAKVALATGKVDVLTLSPIWLPDEGMLNFTKLAIEKNPDARVTVQEFWLPNDVYNHEFPLKQFTIDRTKTNLAELRAAHEKYFADMDEHVRGINKAMGKDVVFVVPVGQAVLKLREKVAAKQVPGIGAQWELFTDYLGHPDVTVQVLNTYCHFAVIYRRSPVGLPVSRFLINAKYAPYAEKLTKVLQELAWDAVKEHPLSGVK